MAGYSNTPLAKKLGIVKPGQCIAFVSAPSGFREALQGLPPEIEIVHDVKGGCTYDIIVFFTDRLAEVEARIPLLRAALQENGGLWIAWPKKASKVPTDVTEDLVRAVALRRNLVDNKVCAIDEVWSGLRLVIPIAHREKKAKR